MLWLHQYCFRNYLIDSFYAILWDFILFITLLNVTMRMLFDRTTVLRTEPIIKFQGRWHDMADQLSDHPKKRFTFKKHISLNT